VYSDPLWKLLGEYHPTSNETLECPICGEAHSFNGCSQRKTASKKAWEGAQKTYKEAVSNNRYLKKWHL